jgi:hypothetical protein
MGKWLNAGMMEEGTVRYNQAGTRREEYYHRC